MWDRCKGLKGKLRSGVFFCGWKLGGLQMKRETLSGEVIHPRRVVWEMFFVSLGRPSSCLFHPFLSFRRLKVDKQVKSRAADSQAVEKIGCDTSPGQLPSCIPQSSESEGFFLDTGSTHVWKQESGLSKPKILQIPFVFAGHWPERRFHLGLRVSWHSPTTWPSLCSKRLWLTWESRLSKDAMKQYQQQKDAKLPEDALCFWNWLFPVIRTCVGWLSMCLLGCCCGKTKGRKPQNVPNPEGVTVKSQTLRTL